MIRIGILLWFVVLLTGCDNDEAEFPELITSEAQQIGSTSVLLEAEIRECGSVRPIQYGFLWGTTPGINLFNVMNKVDLGATIDKRKFSIRLDALTPGTQYFIRSFAAYPDYTHIYYGNEISFITLQ
jgi:hypothetical protein